MADEHRWEDWFRSWSHPESFAHPDSPAGGSGTGFSRPPGPQRYSWPSSSSVPHPDSPADRHFSWHIELPRLVFLERARSVYQAIASAPKYVPGALYDATGQELHSIVSGIIPGLLMFVGVLAATTALGAGAGAAIGVLAFGVGAVPGAALGAELGFDAGIVLLEYLGLAFLAGYIGKSLLQGATAAGEAVQTAWHSVDNRSTQEMAVDRAAHRLAFAVGLVFRGVLQGIVAFLLAKGAAAAASRVPELVSKLRASKLGAGFAQWVEVERNWKGLIESPRLRSPEESYVSGSSPPARGSSGGTEPPVSGSPASTRVQPREPSPAKGIDSSDKKPPDGLAYRTNLPDHLAGPDGFKAGKLNGTHNAENAIAALKTRNAQYSLKPTATPGISELDYRYFDAAKGKYITGAKTVYDPKVYSDARMLQIAQKAGSQGFEQYLQDPAPYYDVTQDGVNFRVYINSDPVTGAPYVGNVHPIK